MLDALIFDVDGTLAETEPAHLAAFNAAFAACGMEQRWNDELYGTLLRVAGGKERLLAWWQDAGLPHHGPQGEKLEDFVATLHAAKTKAYVTRVARGELTLRPGVVRLLAQARQQGVKLALATTTTPDNIDALLTPALGRGWRGLFASIGDGASAPNKKPDPQVYLQVLAALGVPASCCLAIEDSRNGLLAARAAGLACVITPSHFSENEDFTGAASLLSDLSTVNMVELSRLVG